MDKVAHESAASMRTEADALARRLLALRSDIDEILVGLAAAPTAAAPAEAPSEEIVPLSSSPPPQTTDHLTPDDLTLIRGIDAALAEGLDSVSIVAFAQIARWSKREVARVSQALGLGRRICKENWIEQAAMLASGRMTAFAGGCSAYAPASIWQAGQAPERNEAADVHAPDAEARTSPPAHSVPPPVVAATPYRQSAPAAPVPSLAPYRGIPRLARALSKMPPGKPQRGVALAMKVAACLLALVMAGSAIVDRDAWGGAGVDNKAPQTLLSSVPASAQPVREALWPGACSRSRGSCL